MISFEIKPKSIVNGLVNIFLFKAAIIGSDKYGANQPGIWFFSGTKLYVIFICPPSMKVMNNYDVVNYLIFYSPKNLELQKYHSVKIRQTSLHDRYHITVEINGIMDYDGFCSNAKSLTDVNVYASSNNSQADADVRNLYFENS